MNSWGARGSFVFDFSGINASLFWNKGNIVMESILLLGLIHWLSTRKIKSYHDCLILQLGELILSEIWLHWLKIVFNNYPKDNKSKIFLVLANQLSHNFSLVTAI